MSCFCLQEKNNVKYLVIDLFQATGLVNHMFTSRCGGVSGSPFDELNMSFNVGDEYSRLLKNRERVCGILGFKIGDVVAGQQIHRDGIRKITYRDRGLGATSWEGGIPSTDALVTSEKGVLLSSYYADCVPVFLLDPVHRVIGLVHAGWRGTVLRITEKTVLFMADIFGSRPGDCMAGIGPSIGQCCYEVDGMVVSPLKQSYSDWREICEPSGPGRWRLNLWEANRRNLLKAGLKPDNIAESGLCTSCRRDLFFSYRGEEGRTGRMASLIALC